MTATTPAQPTAAADPIPTDVVSVRRRDAQRFLSVELPDLLGLDGRPVAVILDALGEVLVGAGTFDGLSEPDARRVAGTLAFDAILSSPVPSALDAAHRAAALGVREQDPASFPTTRGWRNRRAVFKAHLNAADALIAC